MGDLADGLLDIKPTFFLMTLPGCQVRGYQTYGVAWHQTYHFSKALAGCQVRGA